MENFKCKRPSCKGFPTLLSIPLLSLLYASTNAQNPLFYDTTYHEYMVKAIYSESWRLSTDPSSTGAISVNIDYEKGVTSNYYIEMQRYVGNWITAGLALSEITYINRGYLIGNWGWAKQGTDGSFPGTGDGLHSTSLFIEAIARATVLLENKGVTLQTSDWIARLQLAANYMTDPAIKFHGRSNNLDPFTHRFFLRALGLEFIAFLTGGNVTLSSEARKLVEEGLAKQDPISGILPERGGFDFNYQSISLTFLGKYYMFIEDALLKSSIEQTMMKALPSVQQRVDSLGNIDLTDSTRINELGRNGRPKTIDYPNVIPAYILAHAITGDSRFDTIARLIALPNRPIVEYRFDRHETDGQKSSGTDQDEGNIFARTPENVKDLNPLGPAGSGITGNADDYSYDLSGSTAMGVGPGKFARTGWGVPSLDGLLSFTLVGWMKTDGEQMIGANVELFRTDRFKLTAKDNGYLQLFVDSHNEADSVLSSNNHWNAVGKWMYFAVSYDGTQSTNNVKFYHGSLTSSIALSSTHSLDRQSVNPSANLQTTGARLYVSQQNRPFDGHLDDFRIYGSKTDATGAMSQVLLEEQRIFDFKESGCAGCAVGDPHFTGFDGTKFDFQGVDNQHYLIFGSRLNDSLSGTVRATANLSERRGDKKKNTYFKEFGIQIASYSLRGKIEKTKVRVYLDQVELSRWEVRVEYNGQQIFERRTTTVDKTKIELFHDLDKVIVHTPRVVYTVHGMQLQSRDRHHLDFRLNLQNELSLRDNYVGILGFTLSRRLGSPIHDGELSTRKNSLLEMTLRRYYTLNSIFPQDSEMNMILSSSKVFMDQE